MGPKKKKVPKNAFYFFMCDWKEEKEQEGRRFPGGLKEVAELCQTDWQHLPENLLNYYKRKEKEAKNQDKNDLTNKYTSTGKSYKQLEDERQEAEAFEIRMSNEIFTIMEDALRDHSVLKNRCFYLIHCNVYVYWGEKKKWVPNEVAISEFNLIDGFRRHYHVFPGVITSDGKLPMGYKLESRQRRESVHYIPDPEDFELLEYDYDKILAELMNFLMPNGGREVPPLFTVEDDFNTNNNMSAVRDFLDNVAGSETIDFRVYSLPQFFFHLRNTCSKAAGIVDEAHRFPAVGTASQQLERDYYNFHEELACDFHKGTEGFMNCSVSVVKRWVYLICEFSCPDLGIDVIPGKHTVTTARITVSTFNPGYSHKSNEDSEGWTTVSKSAPASVPPPARPARQSAGAAWSAAARPTSQPAGAALPVVARSGTQPSAWAAAARPVTSSPSTEPDAWPVPSRPAWGRGIVNKPSDNYANPAEMRIPGQATQPPSGVLGRGVPLSSMAALTVVDDSSMVDPNKTRVHKTGRGPNGGSEVLSQGSLNEPMRLPTSQGRAQMLASGKRDAPVPSFSPDDFPAVGVAGSASGKHQRPIASAWGRGQPFGPKSP